MEVNIPATVNVVELENAPFNNAKNARQWAIDHGVVGKMSDEDTKGKGEISISRSSLDKMLSGSALRKSVTPAIHFSALMRLRDIIRESFVGYLHPDYLKINEVRSPENGVNPDVRIAVFYGCVSMGGLPFRAKTTLKLHRDVSQPTNAYSYEISNIEVLTGNAEPITLRPNIKTSMDVSILLNGVCDVNGAPLLVGTAASESGECGEIIK